MNDENTRKVEVIRVGSINLDIDYPAKQIIRLRDISGLYEGGVLNGLADARKKIEAFERGQLAKIGEDHSTHIYDQRQLKPALEGIASSVEDLHNRLRGKRLAGVNVDIWDQISGAYLGAYNTDENGTLILPTDKQFVEVLQWKIAGGGYSDCFNGELARGTPGLFFYFPCSEGGRGNLIKSFPGVSGQQAELPSKWTWYNSAFFNRPALKYTTAADPLQILGASPVGYRSFQFLWYCSDPSPDRTIFQYSTLPTGMGSDADFSLETYYDGEKSVLRGVLAKGTSDEQLVPGETELSTETWYLIHINTIMYGGYTMLEQPFEGFWLEMDVYLGGTTTPEISMQAYVHADEYEVNVLNTPLVTFSGGNNDGFDELRHLDRELYASEIADYGTFLRQGRVAGKSKGSLGSVGW